MFFLFVESGLCNTFMVSLLGRFGFQNITTVDYNGPSNDGSFFLNPSTCFLGDPLLLRENDTNKSQLSKISLCFSGQFEKMISFQLF